MTIAICYVCPEGIVFGADSTASMLVPGVGFHYLNHNQKIFEIGSNSSYGIVTWGLAALKEISHRTLIAQLGDTLQTTPPGSVQDVCLAWINHFWASYTHLLSQEIALLTALAAKGTHQPGGSPSNTIRTQQEETAYQQLKLHLVVGFCIGGVHPTDRTPKAFEILFDPLQPKPSPTPIKSGEMRCWGAPKIVNRLVHGIDVEIKESILTSGKWAGTRAELDALLQGHQLYLPSLPIRDAADFVYSCASSTIKALKFSNLSQTCGGPIEIAVVTSDRDFRWVRHKEWDVAIKEGHSLWKV